jgi:hypothetical protein
MKKEKLETLENLLGELRSYIGYDYCIVPGVIQDGYNIAIYSNKGKLITDKSSYDIESTVKMLHKFCQKNQIQDEIPREDSFL